MKTGLDAGRQVEVRRKAQGGCRPTGTEGGVRVRVRDRVRLVIKPVPLDRKSKRLNSSH